MSAISKFWLGFLTFLPLLFAVVFFGFFISVFLENIIELDRYNHGEFPIEMIQTLGWFVLYIILIVITSLGVRIYYIIHANNNPNNPTNTKILWILLLIFIGTIGSIVYFFVEILPSKPQEEQA